MDESNIISTKYNLPPLNSCYFKCMANSNKRGQITSFKATLYLIYRNKQTTYMLKKYSLSLSQLTGVITEEEEAATNI